MKDNSEMSKVRVKSSHHQPSKAEMEQEYEMPGMGMGTLRMSFFPSLKTQEADVSETLL